LAQILLITCKQQNNNKKDKGMFQNLIDIIAAPSAAFARLKEKPSYLFPLLLVLVSTVSIQIGYFSLVDIDFLREELVDQALASNPNARASEVRAAVQNLNPSVLIISSTVATTVIILVLNALYAAYLKFLSKFSTLELGFRHWFSMTVWTGIPTVLVALAAWVVLLSTGDGRIPQAELQPLSLNTLLKLQSSNRLLHSLSLPMFWSLALLVIGYRQFTSKG